MGRVMLESLSNLKAFARFAGGLGHFLSETVSLEEGRQALVNSLADRETAMLRVLDRGVFRNPRSPYRKLMTHVGMEFPDVETLVRERGVEGALEQLGADGVWVSLEEFKGRKPITRPGLTIETRANDFDNPLLTSHYRAETGGSSGVARRLDIDLDMLVHEAAYVSVYHSEFGILDRPAALWYAVPPGTAGMKNLLRRARVGQPVERWFAQTMPVFRGDRLKDALFLKFVLLYGTAAGRGLASPEHTPLSDARRVAEWLSAKRLEGESPVLLSPVGPAIRVCLAAEEDGIDIRGSFFRVGGEPLTLGRARIFQRVGCEVVGQYSMSETGFIALPCGEREEVDDLHVMLDKIALVQMPVQVGRGREEIMGLFLTTLLPHCPKLMLNVETGDYASVSRRRCGCSLGRLGFDLHLHTIRSYEKLTSEGMTFYGEELIRVTDEILPDRFGGSATDYQFVEDEEDGRVTVSLYASPRLGPLPEIAVVEAALEGLSRPSGTREMMAEVWRQGEVLRLVREEPLSTGVAKILPLHRKRP
jgi:hypothetical protein